MLRQVSAPIAMVSTVCAASGAAKRSGTSERRRETGSVRMVFRGRSWWRMKCRAERGEYGGVGGNPGRENGHSLLLVAGWSGCRGAGGRLGCGVVAVLDRLRR